MLLTEHSFPVLLYYCSRSQWCHGYTTHSYSPNSSSSSLHTTYSYGWYRFQWLQLLRFKNWELRQAMMQEISPVTCPRQWQHFLFLFQIQAFLLPQPLLFFFLHNHIRAMIAIAATAADIISCRNSYSSCCYMWFATTVHQIFDNHLVVYDVSSVCQTQTFDNHLAACHLATCLSVRHHAITIWLCVCPSSNIL